MSDIAAPRPTHSALFAISIDVCGSTRIKQDIVRRTRHSSEARQHLYEVYRRELYRIERNFIFFVHHEHDLDLRKLFLVKTISDELWYTYGVDTSDEQELGRVTYGLMSALSAVESKSYSLTIPAAAGEGAIAYELRLKLSLDLIEESIELNLERLDALENDVRVIAQELEPSDDDRLRALVVDLFNRLNLGSASLNGKKARMAVRTDFIGLDVDRFFRIAGAARPGLILLGDTLVRDLQQDPDWAIEVTGCNASGHSAGRLRMAVRHGGSARFHTHHVITERLTPDHLKGLAEHYDVHHTFSEHALLSVQRPTFGVVDLTQTTRELLGQNGFVRRSPAASQ